jgi:cyclic pyranopterin phosphate synthase
VAVTCLGHEDQGQARAAAVRILLAAFRLQARLSSLHVDPIIFVMSHSHSDFPSFSHLDEAGQVRMVDVAAKASTQRVAVCSARVSMNVQAFELLNGHERGKGEVLNTARVAGVLAAKRCAELIPLCHTLPLSFVGIDFSLNPDTHHIDITSTCRSDYKTGVEMEAMMACSVAALTVYDMCKAVDKGIVVEEVRLLYKSGGKSGEWLAPGLSAPPLAARGQAGPAAVASAPAPGAEAAPGAGARAVKMESPQGATGIRLVYFAQVAELAGTRNETLDCTASLSGRELLQQLEARHPRLAPTGRLKLAVNQRHAQHDVVIQPGDEVAVFEPVTGG